MLAVQKMYGNRNVNLHSLQLHCMLAVQKMYGNRNFPDYVTLLYIMLAVQKMYGNRNGWSRQSITNTMLAVQKMYGNRNKIRRKFIAKLMLAVQKMYGNRNPITLWETPWRMLAVQKMYGNRNSIALRVSDFTGVPIKITDSIAGCGVNSVSTGITFHNPSAFQPFDPASLLGCPCEVHLTQLCSIAIVRHVAGLMGHELTDDQTKDALKWVKTHCYDRNTAIVPTDVFNRYVESVIHTQHPMSAGA